MAADDHEVPHDTSDPLAAPKSHALASKEAPSVGASAASPSPIAEWTASDTRGALNEVGATPVADGSAPIREFSAASGSATSEPGTADPMVPGSATEAAEADVAGTESEAPPMVETAPTNTETAVVARKRSLWPVAAGLVLGAGIGAGSAYYVYSTTAGGASNADQQIAALNSRVDALDKRPDPQQAIAPLKASLADLAGKVAALEALARSKPANPASAASASAPAAAAPAQPTAVDPNVAALQQKIAALQTALASLQQQAASSSDVKAAQAKLAAVATTVADVQKQAAATQGDVQSLKSGQKALEGKITSAPALAVVADSLVEQINRGLPFAAQVNALDSLGVDPAKIAVLRQSADQGVPSAAVLAAKFEPLTDALQAAGTKTPPNASFWERLKAGASSLVSIHRVDDIDGTDVASRIARIKADLARNDVIDAVATWNLLPPEAKTKSDAAAWGALAKTSADAKSAALGVEHDAIAALGSKKS